VRRTARTDVLIGALAALFGAAGTALEGQGPAAWVAGAVLGAALGLYRRHPPVAGALAVLGAAALVPSGDMAAAPAVLVCANAFAVGRWFGWSASAGAAAGLLAALFGAAIVARDPGSWLVPSILVVGTAWVAGRAIRERDLVALRLAERAEELEREREAFATLSVRYERARIASELHDIVAHAISVMVVQAGAGQRIAAADPELAGEMFDAIAGAARQAEQDMTQLVALLSDDEAIGQAPDLALVEELVARGRDGAGRDAEALAGHGTGNGLRGLRERVGAAGGRLEAGPRESGGWRVAAWIPCAVAVAVEDGG